MQRKAVDILKGSKGASMPLALLLFLICATLASVVLAASTAVAGQATTLTSSDQSYYSVTSAAKLFRDELNGSSVTIKQTMSYTESTAVTYQNDAEVSRTVTRSDSPTYTFEVIDESTDAATTKPLTVLQQDAISYMIGGDGKTIPTTSSELKKAWEGPREPSASQQLSVALDGDQTTAQAKALAVTVEQNVKDDGSIEFKFNQGSSSDNEGYKLSLMMTADVDEETSTSEEPQTPTVSGGNGNYTRTDIVDITEVRTTRITWTAADINAVHEGE